MLYNVSFMLNGVDCANLVDADADMETVKEYFIHEHSIRSVKHYPKSHPNGITTLM